MTFSDFNPRPPWGGRRAGFCKVYNKQIISIHALRGEGDTNYMFTLFSLLHFNPRPPWGGRPGMPDGMENTIVISIHALRGEGDAAVSSYITKYVTFQSTPSVGRATR